MAAYKDLVGQKITKVTSNPGEPKTGQMWYNSTNGKLRGLGIVEAFSSGAPLATGRAQGSGAGTQTAGLFVGGRLGPPGDTTACENYNGTGWSSIPSLITARRAISGAGTQTATLAFGGQEPSLSSKTEGYDGTSWSTRPSLATARYTAVGSGTQTSALASGGGNPTATNATEEFTGETTAANITDFSTE